MGKLVVEFYDTTLRDGSQGEGISFSVEDKLRITQKLDDLGIHYIEGGWPGSNPKDVEYFRRVKDLNLRNVKVVAFGSTRRANNPASKDKNLRALLDSGVEVVTIFGKTWDLHVRDVFGISLEENLKMIEDSIKYLCKHGLKVFYDAEHFFDGYKDNPEYALRTLKVAYESGAEVLVLCDTNGGTLPSEVRQIMRELKKSISAPLGVHAHNDCGLAVSNSIVAVEEGAVQVQGTINGYGERCGNADLTTIIGVLGTKMQGVAVKKSTLRRLTEVAHFVAEVCNMQLPNNHPFVGRSAFAHKGGVHINAVMKNPRTYEHIDPTLVGNERRILVSELAGRSSLSMRAKEIEIDLDRKSPEAQRVMSLLQKLEYEGYHFEIAEASFKVLLYKEIKQYRPFFDLLGFRVIVEKRPDGSVITEATVKIRVDGRVEYTVAEGDGPVNALDFALRKGIEKFYPEVSNMHLTDFKVRVLDGSEGTAAKVRVLIQSQDESESWTTIGVSENIIEASWQALVDSVEYKLIRERRRK